MLVPEMPSREFPRIAIACESPELPWHVVTTTVIRMWSPKLTSHVIPRTDLNQVQTTIITVDEGNGPPVVLSADSYRLFELVSLSRKRFRFQPFSSGNKIGY
jgi:hypothetical protein